MLNAATLDIYDLNLIYTKDFEYFLDRSELEKLLSGQAFDHAKLYSPDELYHLRFDINNIYQKVIRDNLVQKKNSNCYSRSAWIWQNNTT